MPSIRLVMLCANTGNPALRDKCRIESTAVARAGRGRGFAVVASEVRSLALTEAVAVFRLK